MTMNQAAHEGNQRAGLLNEKGVDSAASDMLKM